MEARKQLLSVTSPSIQSVDQSPCQVSMLSFDMESRGPFQSDYELRDALIRHFYDLSKKNIPSTSLVELEEADA